jgi:hypothetical protein
MNRYLPIVDFANEKLWYPWKGYIPSVTGIRAFRAIRALNSFFCKMIRERISSFNPEDTSSKNKVNFYIFYFILFYFILFFNW